MSYTNLQKHVAELKAAGDADNYNAAFVLDMLIPLGISKNPDGETKEHFTCKHLQPNGDCGAYLNRPQLCRDFPSYRFGTKHVYRGKNCKIEGCTWKALKFWVLVDRVKNLWYNYNPFKKKKEFLVKKADKQDVTN
jgi:Fe-S-cluster containining protein